MYVFKVLLICLFLFTTYSAQTIFDDILINNSNQNNKGLGRTAIAVHTNGNFAVGWQDYNDYNIPLAEQPRIAVQLFDPNVTAIGPTNLFQGETRTLSIWTSDYLEANSDLTFTPSGNLLVSVEHEGDLSFLGDNLGSSEVGIGAVNTSGEVIDLSNENGVISWLISTETKWLEHPRVSVGPDGSFFLVADGATYNTNNRAVLIQAYDSNGNQIGGLFTPHIDDPGPQANHRDPDVATNGDLAIVAWQDGRNDANWDISAQFYGTSGRIGNNVKINSSDPQGTINVLPSVAMNSSGQSVVAWLDTRENPAGEVYAQRFNPSGELIGGNIKVSYNSGTILDRAEVAILNDGSFMVVWSDNRTNSSDASGYRALGRQFDSNGNPIGEKFIIPNVDIPSGYVNISSNGLNYYCSWLDGRLNTQYFNVYAKVIKSNLTSVSYRIDKVPGDFVLEQNFPNPFNPTTRIKYGLSVDSNVIVSIYNSLGQHIKTILNRMQAAGYHNIDWDAAEFSTGIYIVRIQTRSLETNKSYTDSKKMLLVK